MGNAVSFTPSDLRGGARSVEASIRAGANPDKRLLFKEDVGPLPRGCKCTPLGFALLADDVDMLQALLAAKADPNKPVGLPHKYDLTPLQLAAALGTHGAALAASKLLAAGADPNRRLQAKTGTTCPPPPPPRPVHTAVLASGSGSGSGSATGGGSGGRGGGGGGGGGGGSGADGGGTAAVAAPAPAELIPADLGRTRPGDTALHIAVDAGGDGSGGGGQTSAARVALLLALLEHPATDVNAPNARGRTPLYKAVKRRGRDALELLLGHPRLDVHAGTPAAIFAAIAMESLPMLQLPTAQTPAVLLLLLPLLLLPLQRLLDAGADAAGARDQQGNGSSSSSPLGTVVGRSSLFWLGRSDMVTLLRSYGAPVEDWMVELATARNWHRVAAALKAPVVIVTPPVVVPPAAAAAAAASGRSAWAGAGAADAAAAASGGGELPDPRPMAATPPAAGARGAAAAAAGTAAAGAGGGAQAHDGPQTARVVISAVLLLFFLLLITGGGGGGGGREGALSSSNRHGGRPSSSSSSSSAAAKAPAALPRTSAGGGWGWWGGSGTSSAGPAEGGTQARQSDPVVVGPDTCSDGRGDLEGAAAAQQCAAAAAGSGSPDRSSSSSSSSSGATAAHHRHDDASDTADVTAAAAAAAAAGPVGRRLLSRPLLRRLTAFASALGAVAAAMFLSILAFVCCRPLARHLFTAALSQLPPMVAVTGPPPAAQAFGRWWQAQHGFEPSAVHGLLAFVVLPVARACWREWTDDGGGGGGGGGGGRHTVAFLTLLALCAFCCEDLVVSLVAFRRLPGDVLQPHMWPQQQQQQQPEVAAGAGAGAGAAAAGAAGGGGTAAVGTTEAAGAAAAAGGGAATAVPAAVAAAAAAAAAAAVAGAAAGSSERGGLDGQCCVCMSSRAVMGFVHKEVIHCCVCGDCEAELRRRGQLGKCLYCQRPALAVVRVVQT
ncbi:hypothetical protein HYH02_013534 [Chlamydomonas schloesseri]|uniref:Uncharacterized protein n=1 Tax=Chlamydomonas schloesseri TaxID=2026947 RepID=A0A835VX07_9CHLO|nr:hypothetical protein HYH02_013534 [Chlamydomonas schloesseri]|eukprot:KAG2431005.1 hypothetical protein HYH02_013534 [Chlamydomonas schloesseri]